MQRVAIGLARMPAGRIVSARCFKSKGTYTIGPLILTGKQLTLNARIMKEVDIEVLDAEDKPVSGLTARIKMVDDSSIPINWAEGDLTSVSGKPVKIRFKLYDSEVFALICR